MVATSNIIKRQIEVPSALIQIREDGIMHIHIKVDLDFDMENSLEILDAKIEVSEGEKHPILYTGSKFVIPTNEVREYLASEKRNALTIAEAFLVKSLPQRLISNFYIKINKPARPTKMFTNKEKAMEWLITFID